MATDIKSRPASGKKLSPEFAKVIDVSIKEGASDLHFVPKSHPAIRVLGALLRLGQSPVYTADDLERFVSEMLPQERIEIFQKRGEVDFSYEHTGGERFRCNAFRVRGEVNVAMRLIPKTIKTIADLNLPPSLELFAEREQGFFLVVGPVGQGKTTTLASMIETINTKRAEHILTIEDPIEFQFEAKESIISQREVHLDTDSFHSALEAAFREDVNVLMVGEMRDTETISAAVTAAETGHLVFSTLHTNNAPQTIDRIIDSFHSTQQEQIRIQLAASLAGIFSIRLIQRISGGLIPAYELLVNTSAISNLIREKRTHELGAVLETGAEEGMITMNQSLAELVRRGEVTVESAFAASVNPKGLERLM